MIIIQISLIPRLLTSLTKLDFSDGVITKRYTRETEGTDTEDTSTRL
jgi:hypothetical protein